MPDNGIARGNWRAVASNLEANRQASCLLPCVSKCHSIVSLSRVDEHFYKVSYYLPPVTFLYHGALSTSRTTTWLVCNSTYLIPKDTCISCHCAVLQSISNSSSYFHVVCKQYHESIDILQSSRTPNEVLSRPLPSFKPTRNHPQPIHDQTWSNIQKVPRAIPWPTIFTIADESSCAEYWVLGLNPFHLINWD
jgi:hypothetical protein